MKLSTKVISVSAEPGGKLPVPELQDNSSIQSFWRSYNVYLKTAHFPHWYALLALINSCTDPSGFAFTAYYRAEMRLAVIVHCNTTAENKASRDVKEKLNK